MGRGGGYKLKGKGGSKGGSGKVLAMLKWRGHKLF